MTIKLAISSSSITYRDNKDILIHYNSMKPKHFGVLDILYCKEGGYIIIQPEVEIDPKSNINSFINYCEKKNSRDRELRWYQNKYLVSHCNNPTFTVDEEILLCKVMRFVLGKGNVEYFDTFDNAKKSQNQILDYSPPLSKQQNIINKFFPIYRKFAFE